MLNSVQNNLKNLPLKFDQIRVSDSWDIPGTDNQDNCCMENVIVTFGICQRWSQEPIFKVWLKSDHSSWDIANIEFVVVGGGVVALLVVVGVQIDFYVKPKKKFDYVR